MITLVTGADDLYRPLLNISFANKSLYCEQHRYRMWSSPPPKGFERPASWWKIRWFLDYMEGDFSFWSDADSLIANPEIDLERFIPGPQQHFTMGVTSLSPDGNERRPLTLCCGNFLVRQSPEAHRTLERIWGMYDQFKDDGLWEQAAFTHLWRTDAYVKSIINVVPRHWIDCYELPGNFIAHFGRENGTIEQRAEKMRAFLEKR